jgi:hypothetical protein
MNQPEPTDAWPKSAAAMSLEQVSWITGIHIPDLSRYRSGGKRMSPATRERIENATRAGTESVIVGQRLSSYAQVALVVKSEKKADPVWCLRFLARAMQQSALLTSDADIRAFHAQPPKTGSRGWDAIIAGAAEMTWLRAGMREPLAWTTRARAESPWSPIDYGRRRSWAYLRTPIAMRERNIILARGELETV